MMRHRDDIDGLRALAVLPVLLYHFGSPLLPGGFVGVDIFFVISGFVIAASIAKDLDAGRFSIADFYFKRICRILPALLAMATLTTIVALVFLLPPDFTAYGKSLAALGGFVSNLYFWKASGYFETGAQTKPLLHTWSLAVEEQFYVIAPIALALIHRFGGRRWLLFLVPVTVASFALCVAAVFLGPTAGYFLLPTRAWEPLIGACVALAQFPGPASRALREGLAAAGLALIAAAALLLGPHSVFPGWNALMPALGAACLIQAGSGAAGRPLVNRLLAARPVVWIGLISYSLYLVHWPVVAFFRYETLRDPNAAECVAMLAASLVLAALSWRWVEQPVRRWAQAQARSADHRRARGRTLLAGGGVVVGMIALGLAGVVAHGLPARFPDFRAAEIAGIDEWGGKSCFSEDPSRPLAWDAAACTRTHGQGGRILLWGDSFAAHYAPGLVREASRLDADILQYTFAGCPPILAYYSAARTGCSASNARVPGLIRALGIRHVVIAARWDEVPGRTLDRLEETIATLRGLGVDVVVIGPSPQFAADIQTIDYLKGQARETETADWPSVTPAALGEAVRAHARGARYIDPAATLCRAGRCAYRRGRDWYFVDADHFSVAGAVRAVRAYFPVWTSDGAPGFGTAPVR